MQGHVSYARAEAFLQESSAPAWRLLLSQVKIDDVVGTLENLLPEQAEAHGLGSALLGKLLASAAAVQRHGPKQMVLP